MVQTNKIKVNLITGFLGVGKTTLIKHILAQRPSDQRWAVLVNEFGEMGVDGDLLDEDGVAIEEVAGGCLCCVAAPAFTVGLNRLIRQYKPDHILIEPSGLGHPAQVIETLSSVIYQDILDIDATVCVMDARHLDSSRHREHPNFIDQIHLSDILIANKADQYTAQDEENFLSFAATLFPEKKHIGIVEHGQVTLDCLSFHRDDRQAAFPEAHAFLVEQQSPSSEEVSENPWLIAEGFSDNYHRLGWRIAGTLVFDEAAIINWLNALNIERVKAMIKTSSGTMSYNRSSNKSGNDIAINRVESTISHSKIQLIHPSVINREYLDIELNKLSKR